MKRLTAMCLALALMPGVVFSNAPNPDSAAFTLYGALTGRTVLRHPSLPPITEALPAEVKPSVENVSGLITNSGITLIPRGEKFVLAVPDGLAKEFAAAPEPPGAGSDPEQIIPIHFDNAPMTQALHYYSFLAGKKLVAGEAPRFNITLKTERPLTQSEARYAFEVLFRMRGVEMAVEGDTIKPVLVDPGFAGRPKLRP